MSIVLVNIGTIPNDGTGDVLRQAFNLINQAITALDNGKSAVSHNHDGDYSDINHDHDSDYAAKINEGKVKATDTGDANYLDQVLSFGTAIKNIGNSQELIIALDLSELSDINSADSGVKFAVRYNGFDRLLTFEGLAIALQQYYSIYSISASPSQLAASGDLESVLKIFNSNGTQLTNLSSNQFSVSAINGWVTNVTFSGSGNQVTATLVINPLASPGTYGQEYGAAVVRWEDNNGHYAETHIVVIWDSLAQDEMKTLVVDTWPDNANLDGESNYLVYKKGGGLRVYSYDSGNDQYCYEDYAGTNGACLSTRS